MRAPVKGHAIVPTQYCADCSTCEYTGELKITVNPDLVITKPKDQVCEDEQIHIKLDGGKYETTTPDVYSSNYSWTPTTSLSFNTDYSTAAFQNTTSGTYTYSASAEIGGTLMGGGAAPTPNTDECTGAKQTLPFDMVVTGSGQVPVVNSYTLPHTFLIGENCLAQLTATSGNYFSWQTLNNSGYLIGTTGSMVSAYPGHYLVSGININTGTPFGCCGSGEVYVVTDPNAPACPFVLRKEDTTIQHQINTKSQVDFSVYPNPNEGNFILYFKNNTETKQPYLLEIYNSLGIPIVKFNGELNENEIRQIAERIVLSQGIYYAQLRCNTFNTSLKIVITP